MGAVTYVKEVGFVTNTTAGTTSTITVAAGGVPVGDTIVIYGACDNTGSSGVATTISVGDNRSGSNVYSLQTPQAIADPGAASAGIQGFFVVCPVVVALQAGDIITITYGNSTTAKAINAQQFHGDASTPTVVSGTYTTQNNQTGTTNTVAATPTGAGQAVCALIAVEGGTADSFTEDSDTTNGNWVTLTRRGSGTTTSGATLNSVYKIVTASGAQTYNPALGTARDHCAAILVLESITPPAAYIVQSEIAIQANAVTLPSNVTAGNLIVCSASGYQASFTSVTDNQGNTWSAASPGQTTALTRLYTWWTYASASGSLTITLNATTGDRTIVAAEIFGIVPSSPVDIAGSGATGTSSAPAAPATGTLSQAVEFIWAAMGHEGLDQTINQGSGFTLVEENQGGSANMPINVQSRLTDATTSVTPDWTTTNSQVWLAQRITFKVGSDTTSEGEVTGSISWVGSVTGVKAPQGSVSGAVDWVGSVTGSRPPKGDVSGAIDWAGTVTGETPALLPNDGSVSGAIDWVGSVTGTRAPQGSVSGEVGWVGSLTGSRPPKGDITGSVDWVGSVTGVRTPKGSVSGAVTWGAGVVIGGNLGFVQGAISWVGTVTGTRESRGSVSGAISWIGTVDGEAPAVGINDGEVNGSITWVGLVTGVMQPKGSVSGAISWVGTVEGNAPVVGMNEGDVSGSIDWSGTVTGVTSPRGSVVGSIEWVGSVTGTNITVLIGFIVGDMIDGPGIYIPAFEGPALSRTFDGPELSRTFEGPEITIEDFDGPDRNIETVDGPNTSRILVGPGSSRVTDGPET